MQANLVSILKRFHEKPSVFISVLVYSYQYFYFILSYIQANFLIHPNFSFRKPFYPFFIYIITCRQIYSQYQMSFSPDKVQAELQYEIERRISHQSPTKYDIDFYLRKISRLENDLNQSHDELSKARVRLRRAEDFQIKYDLLLRQNTNLTNDLEKREKQCHILRSKGQIIKAQLDDRGYQEQNWSQEKKLLAQQIELLKSKCEELEEKKKYETMTVRQRADSQIKSEIESIKKDFIEKQEQLTTQIRQLRKTIHQKQVIETAVTNKVEKIRVEKDKQIGRLTKILESKKQQTSLIVRQKNEQIDKLREKFQKMFNFQIQNLRHSLDDQDEVFNIQINGLREILGLKNEEITKLLKQLQESSEQNQKQRSSLLAQIAALKDKIYNTERQCEMQLYNIKQRLSKIHSLEIATLQKKYNDLVDSLKSQRKQLESMLEEKNRIMQAQRKDIERIREELTDRLRQRDARITQLQERIKESGDMNATQMKTLHESFHKIETQKQSMTNQYQANVGFLNQQIAKLISNNEIKNNEIKSLNEEISLIKRHHAQNMKAIEEGWKQERQEREKQREKQREKRQKLQDQIRQKQRQWKAKQRQLQRQKEKEQRQKNKLKYICDELQKDIQRLNTYIKQLDDGLKKQMKKNQISTLDTGGVRRQLTAQLERQKSQLEAIKRMEVDQIKRKLEIEITRLTNQNEKLTTNLLSKELAFEQLESEFKKLEYVNKNIEKINKEKLIEYQKKMATLNNQILLSQNLYKSFVEAKARQKQNNPPR